MPLLLEKFAEVRTRWTPIHQAIVVPGGSTLEHISPLWPGFILGAGKLYENSELHLHTGTMTILGVRGPLSARQLPPGNYAIGDPGLLASEIVPAQEKEYDLGVVPHWSDGTLRMREEFSAPGPGEPWTRKLILPDQPPLDVLTQISQCHRIVTSSLHGMIVADAFGIPRRFEPAGITSLRAGLFKYEDYSASIDLPLRIGEIQEANYNRIEDRKFELFDAYRDLRILLKKNRWLS